MKRNLFLAALLISSSVLANDIDPFGFDKQASPSAKSRAEVRAELKAAQIAGELPVGEIGKAVAVASTATRAQVAAETREAARLGLLSYGEIGPVQATQVRAIGVTAE